MEMLLMGACLSVFGLAVACLAFGAATRDRGRRRPRPRRPSRRKRCKAAASPARFFVDPPVLPLAARTQRARSKRCCSQIENHVRLEQAAAECFLESPNAALLHSRTMSTLVN